MFLLIMHKLRENLYYGDSDGVLLKAVTFKTIHTQIGSNTIDGNVGFVHSQYSCFLSSHSVNSVFVSEKIINNSDNFRIKCFSYSKISANSCVLYFLLLYFFI